MDEPALVPELLVRDLETSLAFWCGHAGFEIHYRRPEDGFAYIGLGAAHLMLEQYAVGRNWVTGPLTPPFGRGINFEIAVPALEPILASLAAAGVALFLDPETQWYRAGEREVGVRQFLVCDPDGYLVRFQTSLGHRPVG